MAPPAAVEAQSSDDRPPTLNLRLTPGHGSLTLQWRPLTDDPDGRTGVAVTHFEARYTKAPGGNAHLSSRDPNTTLLRVGGAGSTSHEITGLEGQTQYAVQIRAVNAAGHGDTRLGDWSGIVQAVTKDTFPPHLPELLSVARNFTLFEVSWTPPDEDGKPITRYDLRHIRDDAPDKSNSNWTELINIGGRGTTRYGLAGLDIELQHLIQVRAVNAFGPGLWSSSSRTQRAGPPDAPEITAVSSAPRAFNISWTAPGNDGGEPITRYDLRHIRDAPLGSSDPAGWTERIGVGGAGATSYQLTGLETGVQHLVQMRAVSALGPGSWSRGWHTPSAVLPDAPDIATTRLSAEGLNVTWRAPSSDGGAWIQYYDVRHIRADAADKSDSNWTVQERAWMQGRGALTYLIRNITPGVQYEVQVRAANGQGPGPWSLGEWSRDIEAPAAPVIIAGYTRHDAVFVLWRTPSEIGDPEITRYDLRYARADAVNQPSAAWTELMDIHSIEGPGYGIADLDTEVSYAVQVRASNLAGYGPWSESWITGTNPLPDAPTITDVTTRNDYLVVSWRAPSRNAEPGSARYELRFIHPDDTDRSDDRWRIRHDLGGAADGPFRLGPLDTTKPWDLQIRAVNAHGAGLWSESWISQRKVVPNAPTITEVVLGDRALTVSWAAPANDGGADIRWYDVRYIRGDEADRSDNYWTVRRQIWEGGVLESLSGPLQRTISHLASGVPYEVQVRAVNAVGSGPWSEGVIGDHPSCLRGAVAVGFSLVVTTEDSSLEDLASCVDERGITALYALHDNQYVSYFLGAPAFVNQSFHDLYAEGVPALTPLVVKSEQHATPDPGAGWSAEQIQSARSWPECFRGTVSDGFSFVLARGNTVQGTVACAKAHGGSSLYALDDGVWVSYMVGAPPFVNVSFIDLFPDGVPALTPLLVKRD